MTTSMPPPPTSSMPPPAVSEDPMRLELDAPLEVARWRIIGNPIMAIPHLIFLYILGIVAEVITVIAWFAILFTGEYPRGMFEFVAGVFRYQWRVATFYLFMREPYPEFNVPSGPAEPGADPATFSVDYPQKLSRGLIFVKWLLVIPVLVWVGILGIGAAVATVIAWFAVLFTGRWPEGMRRFVIGVSRLGYRASIYYYLMSDVYPGFSTE